MRQLTISCAFFLFFASNVHCTGFEVKTSSIIDQPNIEVLGDYKGSWYVIGFEKPGNLNKPPRYKIMKYEQGTLEGKTSPLYPTFGEKTLYLKAAIINNKISLFYGKCDRRVEENDLIESREGHRQISAILRQDYDPNTLEPTGEAQTVFDENEDRFSASGVDIAESNDRTKIAMLIKCYYRQQKYKVILTDNERGQLYSRVIEFKPVKDYLKFLRLNVSNDGQVLTECKVRDDVITLSESSQKKGQTLYYFFLLQKNEAVPKLLSITSPAGRGNFFTQPLTAMLNNGNFVIAYDCFAADGDALLKSTTVAEYGSNFNLVAKKEIVPDSKFIPLAAAYQASKKTIGFPYLETQEILPLEAGSFMLISEYHQNSANPDKTKPGIVERHYIITSALDNKLNLKFTHFIPKKQTTNSLAYAFSARSYRRGNDVYLFHNADWTSDDEHNLNLLCAWIPGLGAEPETKKVLNTSDH
jgi:hypothetical protein